MTRRLILDTETTGLDFDKDRIVEIACLELIDDVFSGEKFHNYYSPENIIISKQSEEIHGLSNDFLKKYNSFESEIQSFLEFIGNSQLIIHNAQFDLNMINSALKRVGKNKIPYEQTLCTLELSKKKFPGSKNNLNALCRRFGISLEEREKHSAITDCFLLLQVFQELNGGKQGNLEFNIYEESINVPNKVKYKNLNLPKVRITEEELENHKKMLKEIPNNFW
ncbi:MAG: exonuclease domain-containing protein [Alphaproteobacteria bacterium]